MEQVMYCPNPACGARWNYFDQCFSYGHIPGGILSKPATTARDYQSHCPICGTLGFMLTTVVYVIAPAPNV